MTRHNTQLNVSNLESYLDQITKKMTNDTKAKINFRAANFLMKLGGIKHLRRALELFNEAHSLTCKIYGENHTRSYNILNFIIKCDKRMETININIKNNKLSKLDGKKSKK